MCTLFMCRMMSCPLPRTHQRLYSTHLFRHPASPPHSRRLCHLCLLPSSGAAAGGLVSQLLHTQRCGAGRIAQTIETDHPHAVCKVRVTFRSLFMVPYRRFTRVLNWCQHFERYPTFHISTMYFDSFCARTDVGVSHYFQKQQN